MGSSVARRKNLAHTNLPNCLTECTRLINPIFSVDVNWWNCTASADPSDGANCSSLTFIDVEKERIEDTTLQSGLYELSEPGSKFLLVAPNFVCNRLVMLTRAFYHRACAFALVYSKKERFPLCIWKKSANLGIFELKHLHERERSWCYPHSRKK